MNINIVIIISIFYIIWWLVSSIEAIAKNTNFDKINKANFYVVMGNIMDVFFN